MRVYPSWLACWALLATSCARSPAPPAAAAHARPRAGTLPDVIPTLSCSAGARTSTSPLPVRRLSQREYQNSLADLFGNDAKLHEVSREIALELAQLPRDGEPKASFSNMDARLSRRHVDTYVKVSASVARAVSERDDRLAALAGPCALEPERNAACFARFVAAFGRRVFRRPLSPSELSRLTEQAATLPARQAYAQVIAELLAAPDFIYHLEREVDTDGSIHALAARLSFHFWQSTPDEALSRAADSGELATDSGYRREVERLVGSQRAHATWFRFFREWLQLDEFSGFSQDRAFQNLAGELKTGSALYDDAVWEVEQLVGYYTFDTVGSYRDLLTSDLVVTRSLRLAELYGVEPWDGRTEPRRFAPGERSGLFTRAAVMISASHATNPFQRGAFVRRRLLCQPLDPPAQRPPEAFVLPPFEPNSATRARYERKVADGGCKGCHELFSPYGYALEPYDALGRFRTVERLIDDDGSSQGRAPIDARVVVSPEPPNVLEVNGPVELAQALSATGAATECFARQYFRFSFRRQETEADACTLNAILAALERGGLLGAYRDVAFIQAFRGRAQAGSP